jgi:sulfur-oxidizing protein SoxZ
VAEIGRAIVRVPAEARRGEVVEVRTLVAHPMETGFRRDSLGQPIPRDILTRLVCTYNGEEVFRADLFPAVSANPYVSFFTVATESGELTFTWTDQDGRARSETARITVT